jgi:DMSO/TMAO reductase YedYZ molybdopterin-dependent catalytic subunit
MILVTGATGNVSRELVPMLAQWARLESSVNRGPWGNPDPYFVSLDLSTARHPQTLLATHLNGKPLTDMIASCFVP